MTNHGPQAATGVTVVNELPPDVVVPAAGGGGSRRRLPAQVPSGCLPTGATVTCVLGSLAGGESRTMVFAGTVAAPTAAGTQLVHAATVRADGVDAVEANNRDTDVIVVVARVITPPTTAPPGRGRLPTTGFAVAAVLVAAGALVLIGTGTRPATDRRRRGARR